MIIIRQDTPSILARMGEKKTTGGEISVGLNPYMLYFSSRWRRARELDEKKYTQCQMQRQALPTCAHIHTHSLSHTLAVSHTLAHVWAGPVNGKGFKLSEYESITEQIENV